EADLGFRQVFARASWGSPALFAASQAGFVTNLKDGLLWALAPLHLAQHGLPLDQIGLVAGVYPAVWGFGQLVAGPLSDRSGRRLPIGAGMAAQALGLALFAGGDALWQWTAAAAVIGAGTAL